MKELILVTTNFYNFLKIRKIPLFLQQKQNGSNFGTLCVEYELDFSPQTPS